MFCGETEKMTPVAGLFYQFFHPGSQTLGLGNVQVVNDATDAKRSREARSSRN